MQRYFNEVAQHCGNREQVILDYFETMYIGEVSRGVQRQPRYAHAFWNVHDRVQDDLPRTTNAVEAWHNSFNQSVGQAHASIWTFINCLKREHALVHLQIAQFIAGVAGGRQRRENVQLNERLRTIVLDVQNRDPIQYLRGVSHSLAM